MAEVVVSENITGTAMDTLRAEFDVAFEPDAWQQPDRLKRLLADARALIVRNQTRVTGELIQAAGKLEIIARAGAGLDNVDDAAASAAGITVSYTPDANSVSAAEMTIGLALTLARKISAADRDTRAGEWNRRTFTGVELMGKTLGIVGLGRIGTLVARRARAFGMTIIAHDEFLAPDAPRLEELEAQLVGLDELLGAADIVSCHVPLTEQTAGLFDYHRFCRMKPSGLFLNTSRGEVVDEQGLYRALSEQRLAGAALDVRQTEPPELSPLCSMDNVVLTPHIAAFTSEAQQRVVAAVCRDVRAVLNGQPAIDYANFARPERAEPR